MKTNFSQTTSIIKKTVTASALAAVVATSFMTAGVNPASASSASPVGVSAVQPAVKGQLSLSAGVPSSTVSISASAPTRTGVAVSTKTWAQKTRAFAVCIFAVGIPVGVAIGIAWNPQVWAWVIGRGPWPASVGGFASAWLNTAKRSCAYALF